VRHLFKYYKFRLPAPPTEVPMTAGPLTPGIRYAQSFVAEKENLTKVEVEFASYAAIIGEGFVRLHLRPTLDAADDIASVTIPLHAFYNNAFVGLQFAPIPDSRGKRYYVVFETPEFCQPVTVLLRDGDGQSEDRFFVGGEARTQSTYFRTFYAPGA
jgi:hypothetical protein